MSNPSTQYAFSAGEVSPSLKFRTDLEKYDLAVAEAVNFFTEYTGGLSSRPGGEFVQFLFEDGEHKIFPFVFGSDLEDTYMVVITKNKIRVIQNGQSLLGFSKDITGSTNGNPTRIISPDHGFFNGDLIYMTNTSEIFFNRRTFRVGSRTNDDFRLVDPITGANIDSTNVGEVNSGKISPLIELESPYTEAQLSELKAEQVGSRDYMRLTHVEVPTYNLIRNSERVWSIELEERGNEVPVPKNLKALPSGSGNAGIVWTVSVIDTHGNEGLPARPKMEDGIVAYTETEGQVVFRCNPVVGAKFYQWYRSNVTPDGAELTLGEEVGYIGRTTAPRKVDANIIPDFSLAPPVYVDPFAPGAILSINLSQFGANYKPGAPVIITDPNGEGFVGYPVVDAEGQIVDVIIVNPGRGYTNPTVSFSSTYTTGGGGQGGIARVSAVDGSGAITGVSIISPGKDYTSNIGYSIGSAAGTGAGLSITLSTEHPRYPDVGSITAITIVDGGANYEMNDVINFTDGGTTASSGSGAKATATVGPSTGLYPGVSAIYQQRQYYAGSLNQPLTIWASRPGRPSNFDISSILTDADALELTLDAKEVSIIRHLLATQSGLLVMNNTGIWMVYGAEKGGPVTPLKYSQIQLSENGVADLVPPVKVDQDIVFVQAMGKTVRALSYNQYSGLFDGLDVSVLAEHLFKGTKVVSMAYGEVPHKMFVIIFDNGMGAFLTYLKEQQVYAWTQFRTNGDLKRVVSLREGDQDRFYYTVSRVLQGGWRTTIERLSLREGLYAEDFQTLDCAVPSQHTPIPYELKFAEIASNGTIVCTTSNDVFASAGVGQIIHASGATLQIINIETPNRARCNIIKDFRAYMGDTTRPMPARAGTWRIDSPRTNQTALWHLEGESVTVIADGVQYDNRVVTNGAVTVPVAATTFTVGFPFQAWIKTLPISSAQASIEGRRRSVTGISLAVKDSNGLSIGKTKSKLYDLKTMPSAANVAPTLRSDLEYFPLTTPFDKGEFYIYLKKAVPATVLGYAIEFEVGDDYR